MESNLLGSSTEKIVNSEEAYHLKSVIEVKAVFVTVVGKGRLTEAALRFYGQ